MQSNECQSSIFFLCHLQLQIVGTFRKIVMKKFLQSYNINNVPYNIVYIIDN